MSTNIGMCWRLRGRRNLVQEPRDGRFSPFSLRTSVPIHDNSHVGSLDDAADIGTVVAALLALGAIVYSALQARANARLIAEERHTSVQLQVLRELVDLVNGSYLIPEKTSTGTPGTLRSRAIQARLLIVDAELPFTRKRYRPGISDTKRLQALGVTDPRDVNFNDRYIGDSTDTVRDRMSDEITRAIRELATSGPRKSRRGSPR